jgi:hypothetical protein
MNAAKEIELAARKRTARKLSKSGNKMLSWSKVRRTIEELGWDTQLFIKQYEALGRVAHGMRKPDSALLSAGAAFDISGDLDAFRHAVAAKNTQELYAKLGRYQAWKSNAASN